jgi:hypothetical protein
MRTMMVSVTIRFKVRECVLENGQTEADRKWFVPALNQRGSVVAWLTRSGDLVSESSDRFFEMVENNESQFDSFDHASNVLERFVTWMGS